MFEFLKKAFIALLNFRGPIASIVNVFYHAKCMPLSNQSCMNHSTIISLHRNDYFDELHYYAFTVNLYRCIGSFNTINDLSNKICVPDKTEDLNLSAFNTITRKN